MIGFSIGVIIGVGMALSWLWLWDEANHTRDETKQEEWAYLYERV